MTSAFTPGKGNLELPGNGDYVDSWNTPLNADLTAVDACFSATSGFNLSNVTVNLTQAQMRCQRILFQGTLTANVLVNLYAGISGIYIVASNATGAFTAQLGQGSGPAVSIPQGAQHTLVFADGNGVFLGDVGGIASVLQQSFVQPGALQDFAMPTAPTGWLFCNGALVSRATYAPLFANIGTTWGVGDGSTTFNLPNLQGHFRRGWDLSGVVDPGRAFASQQADALASHGHGINDPQHFHAVPVTAGVNQAGFNNSSPFGPGGSSGTTSSSATGITVQASVAPTPNETRPRNFAILTCIKT